MIPLVRVVKANNLEHCFILELLDSKVVYTLSL